MSKNSTGQLHFLDRIAELVPPNHSLVNELSDTLQVSVDSAYRRLRGETQLTYDEIVRLCNKYDVSFDSVNSVESDYLSFRYHSLKASQEGFLTYFTSIYDELKKLNIPQAPNKQVTYACNGIPVFHYFKTPTLGAFKMHYWMNAIMNVEDLKGARFEGKDSIQPELLKVGQNILNEYMDVPSTEMWTATTVMGVIYQIQFYWESGTFLNDDVALQVCEEVHQLIDMVQTWAEKEMKHLDGRFKMYFSEINFENNCILTEIADYKRVWLSHLSFSAFSSGSLKYAEETRSWLDNLRGKSHLISGASQTTRYKFFKRCHKLVQDLENKIKEG